ncbi:MAG: hypothetical protein J6K85_02390 [Clostridia bacterium]|nr:hypothetical protein [Clostridia bacterium]
MKNEFMANAITKIDSRLIDEAEDYQAKKATILTPNFVRGLYRYGSMAACLMLIVGAMIFAGMRGDSVLLYGESISGEARMITEYIPRSIAYSVEPEAITEVSLPLELEFSRKTTLTLDYGEMVVIDSMGNEIYRGQEYCVKGKASICIVLPSDISSANIQTDRNYNIVLTQEEDSEFWYVNIDKK